MNDKHVLHPMAHPIHLHGQRFLVLARNGVPNEDLVWHLEAGMHTVLTVE